jgi:YfiR/HmsC-like
LGLSVAFCPIFHGNLTSERITDFPPSAPTQGSLLLYSQNKKKEHMKTVAAFLVAGLMMVSGASIAQDRPMHEIYSMMVFNFIKYVQWPDHDKPGEFVIGVVGNNDVFTTLTTWYGGKAKGNKTYVIKKFASAAEVTDCHLVYIDKSKSGEFDAINNKVKGKGTLVVTDKNGLGQKGSCINFKTVEDKLRFELNQQAVEASNLKVSGALSSMAIII